MSFLVRKAGRGAAQKLLAGMEPNDPHYEVRSSVLVVVTRLRS